MLDAQSLKGQVALVTGAGRGLGWEIARQLLDAGAVVTAHYRSSADGVKRLIETYGTDRCSGTQTDLESDAAPQVLFEAVMSRHNRIDILVNSAALLRPVPSISDVQVADMMKAFRVNSAAPFHLTNLAARDMAKRKSGRVVSISSIGIKFAGSGQTAHYMVSKAALEAGMAALAKAYAAQGVLINVIRAGVMRTGLQERIGRDVSAREAMIPMRRAAQATEVASAVVFLVSPANTYITGAVLPVSGGE